MYRLSLILASLIVVGCMTVSDFYTDIYSRATEQQKDRIILSTTDPHIYRYSADVKADDEKVMSDGYILLGYARFNAANLNNYQIVDQAKKVGAAIVMVSSKYTGTNIGSIPITTYNPGQTSTSIITGDINGTVTTTSSGTSQTQYVPYSVNRYDYLVTFWAKTKPPAMGIFFDDLPLSIRQELERNKGLLITAVVKDSPAYNANVIPGDVAIEMNGIELTSKQQFLSLIMQNAGQKVVLKIIRKGQVKEIELQLND